MKELRESGQVSHVCKKCKRPLNYHEFYENGVLIGSEWRHGVIIPGTPAHYPEPVTAAIDEQVSVCDFCSATNPPWTFPTKSFTIEEKVNQDFTSVTDWSACDTCKDLILAEKWSELADRTIKALTVRPPSAAARQKLLELHQAFKVSRDGHPYLQ